MRDVENCYDRKGDFRGIEYVQELSFINIDFGRRLPARKHYTYSEVRVSPHFLSNLP